VEMSAEAGLAAWIWSGSQGGSDFEPIGTYAWSIRRSGTRVWPGAGVRGQAYLGSDVSSTSNRFTHVAELHLGFPVGPAMATASAGVPLKDFWRDSVPFILGVQLSWEPVR